MNCLFRENCWDGVDLKRVFSGSVLDSWMLSKSDYILSIKLLFVGYINCYKPGSDALIGWKSQKLQTFTVYIVDCMGPPVSDLQFIICLRDGSQIQNWGISLLVVRKLKTYFGYWSEHCQKYVLWNFYVFLLEVLTVWLIFLFSSGPRGDNMITCGPNAVVFGTTSLRGGHPHSKRLPQEIVNGVASLLRGSGLPSPKAGFPNTNQLVSHLLPQVLIKLCKLKFVHVPVMFL